MPLRFTRPGLDRIGQRAHVPAAIAQLSPRPIGNRAEKLHAALVIGPRTLEGVAVLRRIQVQLALSLPPETIGAHAVGVANVSALPPLDHMTAPLCLLNRRHALVDVVQSARLEIDAAQAEMGVWRFGIERGRTLELDDRRHAVLPKGGSRILLAPMVCAAIRSR